MPVSSPSYFPPQRNVDRIVGLNAGNNQTGNDVFLSGLNTGLGSTSSGLIAIGTGAVGAVTGQNNAVIIGVSAATALVTASSSTYVDDGPVIIGYKALQNTAHADNCVIIGSNNLNGPNFSGDGAVQSVLIGCHVAGPSTAWIGTNNFQQNVMIGYGIFESVTAGYNPNGNVLIGVGIAGSGNATQFNPIQSVVIGLQACYSGVPSNCIAIGTGALSNSINGGVSSNVIAIGVSAAPNVDHGPGGIFIGHDSGNGFDDTHQWIVIGSPTGSTYPALSAFTALNNPQSDGTYNVALAGIESTANLELTGARNIVVIPAGTVGTVSPSSGGYLYVTGTNNDAHWVNSAGVDANLSQAAQGALPYTYNVPVTGFALTIANGIQALVLNPAGTLAAGTVTLPAAPIDGGTVIISTTQTITALTISPNTGQTVADAPATLGIGGAVRFLYNATTATWYRIGN